MSVYVMATVWRHSRASGTALLVLLALADHAHDDGTCFPGHAGLADKCRVSEMTIRRRIDDLVSLGELHVTERPGRSNIYRIAVDNSEQTLFNLEQPVVHAAEQGVCSLCVNNESSRNINNHQDPLNKVEEEFTPADDFAERMAEIKRRHAIAAHPSKLHPVDDP